MRHDGPAEVRLYYAPELRCTFHVFLYAKGAEGRPGAVEYFEARNIEGQLTGDGLTACYRALVRPGATS